MIQDSLQSTDPRGSYAFLPPVEVFEKKTLQELRDIKSFLVRLERKIDGIRNNDARQHEWYKREEFLDEVVERIKNKQIK